MNIYRLGPQAKQMYWSEWKRIGGCGLSQAAENEIKRFFGKPILWRCDAGSPVFLGDLATGSVLADREMARNAGLVIQLFGQPAVSEKSHYFSNGFA